MSPRRIIFIVVALLVSGLTIFLGRSWLEAERNAALEAQRNQQQPAQQPTTMILVAKGNLLTGQFVRPENLRWQPWPNDGISPSYVVQGQRMLEDFIGAVVRTGMGDGEPITDTRLVRPGDRGFLAAVLEPGHRAVTVNVTPSSGVAGFIFPGDHVDLIVTMMVKGSDSGTTWTYKRSANGTQESKKDSQNRENRVSETVLTDIRVLAMDQRVDDQTKDVVVGKTATLEVTPKQAEVIAVVSELGKISLSLRSVARDEAEAAAASGRPKLTYTFDSDATRLIAPPNPKGPAEVEVVRGERKQDHSSFWSFF